MARATCDCNCFRREKHGATVQKESLIITEERANELEYQTIPDHAGGKDNKHGMIGALSSIPAINPSATGLLCHYIGGIFAPARGKWVNSVQKVTKSDTSATEASGVYRRLQASTGVDRRRQASTGVDRR